MKIKKILNKLTSIMLSVSIIVSSIEYNQVTIAKADINKTVGDIKNKIIEIDDGYQEDIIEVIEEISDKIIIEDVMEEAIYEEEIVEEDYYFNFESYEIEMLASVVMAEAGNQCELGKRLVVDTILNRVDDPKYPSTIIDNILYPNAFSCVSDGGIYRHYPDDYIYDLIYDEMACRTNYDVMYFRTGYYHSFGEPVDQVGDHYFSK